MVFAASIFSSSISAFLNSQCWLLSLSFVLELIFGITSMFVIQELLMVSFYMCRWVSRLRSRFALENERD